MGRDPDFEPEERPLERRREIEPPIFRFEGRVGSRGRIVAVVPATDRHLRSRIGGASTKSTRSRPRSIQPCSVSVDAERVRSSPDCVCRRESVSLPQHRVDSILRKKRSDCRPSRDLLTSALSAARE